ncbi:MAG: hypothetical protein D6722_09435 [Bacteroidetes bacterium]|nr:MAG: hypothetical protein D6722_09435 [Bacteroidota bacterium]
MSYKVSLSTEETYLLADYMQAAQTKKQTRRLLAISLRHFGYQVQDIARVVGVSEKTVTTWIKLFLEGGFDALVAFHYPEKRQSQLEPYTEAIRSYQKEHPEATLKDLHAWLAETQQLEIDYSWLYRYVTRHGLWKD